MMEIYWLFVFFLFGTTFGSFYNVVGLRVPKTFLLLTIIHIVQTVIIAFVGMSLFLSLHSFGKKVDVATVILAFHHFILAWNY